MTCAAGCNDSRARFYVGDVRDFNSVHGGHGRRRPRLPCGSARSRSPQASSSRCRPWPRTSIGSDNVIRAAHECGVKSVVCLSTDKAVYPINAMGMSKALMEKVAQAFARNHPDSPTTVSDHAIRERDVLPWLGDSLVRRAVARRQAGDHHGPEHDPLPHVPGGIGRTGPVCLQPRQARRPLHPEGPGDRRSTTWRRAIGPFWVSMPNVTSSAPDTARSSRSPC